MAHMWMEQNQEKWNRLKQVVTEQDVERGYQVNSPRVDPPNMSQDILNLDSWARQRVKKTWVRLWISLNEKPRRGFFADEAAGGFAKSSISIYFLHF